jgi:SP family galactose:H+ symporter-like MFS transporter
MSTATQSPPRPTQPVSRRLLVWALSASLGGFAVGYNLGIIAGALLSVRRDFGLSAFQQGALASVLPLGALAGGLTTTRLADAVGRRRTLLLAAGAFIASSVAAAVAGSYGVLLAARGAAGVAVGAASSTVPLYLSEIAPPRVRGRLVTINQLMLTLGILASYCVGLAFHSAGSWRSMFAVGTVPAAALLIAMLRAPETPVWLAAHGRADRAREVIAQVADRDEADRLIGGAPDAEAARRQESGGPAILRSAARPALVIGVTLAVLQQFSGINTIIYFGPTIMEKSGLSASNSLVSAIIIGVVNVAATVVSFRLVDRLGRRPLLRLSLLGMVVSLTLLGLSLEVALGAAGSWLSLLCSVGFVASFALGMGPVFWLLIAEIFPPGARASGASISTAVVWCANFAVGLMFLPLAGAIGQGPTFWVFAAVCVVALVFVERYVPETKGRPLADISVELDRRLGARR